MTVGVVQGSVVNGDWDGNMFHDWDVLNHRNHWMVRSVLMVVTCGDWDLRRKTTDRKIASGMVD
jgi:hypothetical protein